jgi:hypothetical protein
MRVQFRALPPSPSSPREAQFVAPEVRFPFTPAREYEVYAVSVYDGVVFVLVIDDLNSPLFTPRSLFETVDAAVPARWICNVFAAGPVPMILGPEFIARDLASYDRFIDCDGEQMTAFWKMVEDYL